MDSILQERLFDIQSDGKPVLYFIYTDRKFLGSSAVRVIQSFGNKWSYYYWRFERRILLSKISAKQPTANA